MATVTKKVMAAIETEARKNERLYKNNLMRLVAKIKKIVMEESDPADIVAVLRTLSTSKEFSKVIELSVRRMITGVSVAEKRSWRMAASSSMMGKRVYAALVNQTNNTAVGAAINEIVANNSKLIKTVPSDLALQFSRYAQEMQMKGIRPEAIAAEMQAKAPQLAAYQLRRIARTESAKAATALTQTRSLAVGCEWYIWHTCQDERVRDSHAPMEGILCRWSDPPSPETLFPSKYSKPAGNYHPGGIYNCRCIALPVIALEDIKFPVKAHFNGKIVTIGSLNEFKERVAA